MAPISPARYEIQFACVHHTISITNWYPFYPYKLCACSAVSSALCAFYIEQVQEPNAPNILAWCMHVNWMTQQCDPCSATLASHRLAERRKIHSNSPESAMIYMKISRYYNAREPWRWGDDLELPAKPNNHAVHRLRQTQTYVCDDDFAPYENNMLNERRARFAWKLHFIFHCLIKYAVLLYTSRIGQTVWSIRKNKYCGATHTHRPDIV